MPSNGRPLEEEDISQQITPYLYFNFLPSPKQRWRHASETTRWGYRRLTAKKPKFFGMQCVDLHCVHVRARVCVCVCVWLITLKLPQDIVLDYFCLKYWLTLATVLQEVMIENIFANTLTCICHSMLHQTHNVKLFSEDMYNMFWDMFWNR
jgi:hypothetical protein